MQYFLRLAILCLWSAATVAQVRILDNANTKDGWTIIQSDGVKAELQSVKGNSGNALALSYHFIKGTGYCGIQKRFDISLPENFRFIYSLKGLSTDNNLEVKFLDSSRNNVWWYIKRNFTFPTNWKSMVIKKKNIEFAWGPTTDRHLQNIAYVEFTISSANGGKGTILIDDFQFEPLPEISKKLPAIIAYENENTKFQKPISELTDENRDTEFHSMGSTPSVIKLDLQSERELGGLILRWGVNRPKQFAYALGSNKQTIPTVWNTIPVTIEGENYLNLQENQSAAIYLKIPSPFSLKEIEVKDETYSPDENRFYMNIVKEKKRGLYPRYLYGEATFWTINGVDSDDKEALISMDGAIEPVRGGYTIEPFITQNGVFYHWDNVKKTPFLPNGYLPLPNVTWSMPGSNLNIEAFSTGKANVNSTLYATYTITNTSDTEIQGTLWLTIRPFQVNPHYQWLNMIGGVAPVYSIERKGQKILVNKEHEIYLSPLKAKTGFTDFHSGDITSFIGQNEIPGQSKIVKDETGKASGVIAYDYHIPAGGKITYYLAMPYYPGKTGTQSVKNLGDLQLKQERERAIAYWKEKLDRVQIKVPKQAEQAIASVKSNLAYILINKDNDALQPGARSYDRSWIRDGAMISASLLHFGLKEEVKRYIEWYAPYQFEDGKVPCVVDRRGPDPVPENDSQGELIYLISQYFKYTHDTALVRRFYPNIKKAVAFNLSMTEQRKTDVYRLGNDSLRSMYGLLLESISHEGYSDKPRHSYWDNFFALRGFKDAAELALMLGEKEDAKMYSAIRDTFRSDFYASIALTAKRNKIDYIAGCAELGDFDATSTSIVNYLCAEQEYLDPVLLKNTFDRYYTYFTGRKERTLSSVNYTPYEVRLINTFVHLGQKDRALDLLQFFLKDQYPEGFRHWAEVVWDDSSTDKFIGDMPHSWVGGDYIASLRSFFIYENEFEDAITIAAGIPQQWVDAEDGIAVKNMPVYSGSISYKYEKTDSGYRILLDGNVANKDQKFKVGNVSGKLPKLVLRNGKPLNDFDEKFIKVQGLPVQLELVF